MDTRLPLGARLSLDAARVAAAPAPVLAALPRRDRAPDTHLNADLIASLPRGGLDALLPAASEAVNVAQPHVHDRATLVDAAWEVMPAWAGGTAPDMRYVDIASAIDRAPFVYMPGADVGAAVGDTARSRSLLNRARQAGLSDAELRGLETGLRSGKFDTADAMLMGRLLDSPNAARALRTFLDLASLREQYPKRVTHSVVETLSMGVAHPRTGAAGGDEGLLSPAQAHAAAMALAEMSTRDFETIQFALFFASPLFQKNPRADAQVQAALALKAVAARRDEFSIGEAPLGLKLNLPPSPAAQDIARFIAQTKDVDADVLIARTSGIDLEGGGAGLAADHIERLLEIGIDVPIAVTSPSGDTHAKRVTDVRGSGDAREFLVSDPSSGRAAWVSCGDLVTGNVDGAGGRLSACWW